MWMIYFISKFRFISIGNFIFPCIELIFKIWPHKGYWFENSFSSPSIRFYYVWGRKGRWGCHSSQVNTYKFPCPVSSYNFKFAGMVTTTMDTDSGSNSQEVRTAFA